MLNQGSFLVCATLISRILAFPQNNNANEPPQPDPGAEYGSVNIMNDCDYDIYAKSSGAWPEDHNQDEVEFIIPSHGNHREPYREVIYKGNGGTDPITKKTKGQGISIKMTRLPEKKYDTNILQLEYSLIDNPERPQRFRRLEYDVSLLNCAVPPEGPFENMTDKWSSTALEWNQRKIDGCPGYTGGLALWTGDLSSCRPIYCDGVNYCDGIYNYDTTRAGEMSLSCNKEYQGDLSGAVCYKGEWVSIGEIQEIMVITGLIKLGLLLQFTKNGLLLVLQRQHFLWLT